MLPEHPNPLPHNLLRVGFVRWTRLGLTPHAFHNLIHSVLSIHEQTQNSFGREILNVCASGYGMLLGGTLITD
uniref:Uncharacterized protein n=1 Tax=Anguilla anguilla TaxID=7936 RepID=A0A0E9WVB6_ANGAN